MLRKFKVEGFKNFNSEFILDLSSPNNYQYNSEAIKNNIIKNVVLYGRNASGKSNLGLALFDIVSTLTDNNSHSDHYEYFLNRDYETDKAKFTYEFVFDEDEVIYSYSKNEEREILEESLHVNGKKYFEIIDNDLKFSNGGLMNLSIFWDNYKERDRSLSFLKYINANTVFSADGTYSEILNFVNGMLWYASDGPHIRYIGLQDNARNFFSFLHEDNSLKEFENLLIESGINKRLEIMKDNDGKHTVYAKGFTNYNFLGTASKGTKDLYNFFYWTTRPKISFLFIDEFDSYFHFELATSILRNLINREYQSMVTTHNVMLLSNEILRPDCYFIIDSKSIYSINSSKLNNNELRRGHNLSSMYAKGLFDRKNNE